MHRTRMMHVKIFDDDGGLGHRTLTVFEHGEQFEWPQRRKLGERVRLLGRQRAVFERRVVLIERDQRFLAVGRERMRIELEIGH
jgi:hypothetical protein